MPEISRFYGIIIRMNFNDHAPPNFHAEYGDKEGIIHIKTLALISGDLPRRALGLVIEWASLHQQELISLWEKAQMLEPLSKIDPL
jgi:hypothetical protein